MIAIGYRSGLTARKLAELQPTPPMKTRTILFLSMTVLASLARGAEAQLQSCDRIRILPAPGHEKEIVGAKISGSISSAKTGMVVLGDINQAPAAGDWLELAIKNPKPYRWLRYDAPEGSRGWIAKLELYAGEQRLKGDYFSCWPDAWRSVLDDRPSKGSAGVNSGGQYFGLDIGEKGSCPRPMLTPGGRDCTEPLKVAMRSSTPGATIRYTTDGTAPTLTNGETYSEPIAIDHTTTLNAAAFLDGLAPSPGTDALYLFNPAPKRVVLNFGNSLTGNATGRIEWHMKGAGKLMECKRQLMGGGLTRTLWNAAMLEIADPNDKAKWISLYQNTPCLTHTMGGDVIYSFEQVKAAHDNWATLWPSISTLDDVTFQPRDGDVAKECDYTMRWLKLVREKFPKVQPWIYIEWDEVGRQRETDKATVPSYQMKTLFPALTWEESMSAMMLYGEEVEHEILKVDAGQKKARIIPVALAMGRLHDQIARGEFPDVGPNSYIDLMQSDIIHAGAEGSYLIELVWFAAMDGESPVGKYLPLRLGLTPAQANAMQRLAWEVVKNYPDCGLYEVGKEPCGKPRISNDGKVITLNSTTPGAWFRYTLDGSTPTRTRGYIYCGAISVQPGIAVKAVAYQSGMADSEVAAQ